MGEKESTKNLKDASKRGLKVMGKSKTRHPVRKEGRIMKYGAKGFFRNIWLSTASTIVMAITMIILFVTVVASVILTNTAEMMKDKIDITIYFKPNTSTETLSALSDLISTDSNIKTVTVSTSEEEYEKIVEENSDSEGLISVFDEDLKKQTIAQLPSIMRIKVYNIDNIESVKAIVEGDPLFTENLNPNEKYAPTYDVNQAEIATITSWARIARTGGIVLAVVFLIISILIIFSTIRMAIFSRREEIYMMKLVGADGRFIRGPFLIEAEMCGVIAGIISAIVSYIGFMMLAPKLEGYGIDVASIKGVLESNQLILVFLIFIVSGVVIGRISATLAVSKYLHKS